MAYNATEKYGVTAKIDKSQALTPISTDTRLIFVAGGAKSVVKIKECFSLDDFKTAFPDDLQSALYNCAHFAFNHAGLSKAVFVNAGVNLSDSPSVLADLLDRYIGETPNVTDLWCIVPNVADNTLPTVLGSNLLSVIKNADRKWKGYALVQCNDDWFTSSDLSPAPDTCFIDLRDDAKLDKIVKPVADEYCGVCTGSTLLLDGSVVQNAIIRACLQCVQDYNYKCTARCGGNLNIPSANYAGYFVRDMYLKVEYDVATIQANTWTPIKLFLPDDAEVKSKAQINGWNADGTISTMLETVETHDTQWDVDLRFSNGKFEVFSTDDIDDGFPFELCAPNVLVKAYLPEAYGTKLSAGGVNSWNTYGSGILVTWGDHTSAFSDGTITEERGRFDNYVRTNIAIANRFCLKYRFSVDAPLTLQMRNQIIAEQQDYLNSLVALGALIGSPKCLFQPIDNSQDDIQQGYFVWRDIVTDTPPAKHLELRVQYTTEGLSVYLEEA